MFLNCGGNGSSGALYGFAARSRARFLTVEPLKGAGCAAWSAARARSAIVTSGITALDEDTSQQGAPPAGPPQNVGPEASGNKARRRTIARGLAQLMRNRQD